MRDDNEMLIVLCRLWKIPALGPEVNAPVVSQIPTLLLSGRFDPITPAYFAEAVAKTLSNSYTYTFPNTSHGAFLFNACANHIVHSFLDNPNTTPDASCIASEPTTLDIPTPSTVVMTPAMAHVLDTLNGQNLSSLALLLLSLLSLLSFILVWPLAYLIRKLRKLPPQKAPPIIAWAAPALVILFGGLSLLFVSGLAALTFSSDLSVLWVGIPKAAAPLFVIPILLLLLAAGMTIITGVTWPGSYWSVWRRLYFSLLTLSALIFVGVLLQWEMLTVFL
jgi:hypothetical protein